MRYVIASLLPAALSHVCCWEPVPAKVQRRAPVLNELETAAGQ